MERGVTKLTAMDKSEQRNDETQTREGFSKLMEAEITNKTASKGDGTMKYHLTKYYENGKHYAESWLQINIFGKCFCFSRRRLEIGEGEGND